MNALAVCFDVKACMALYERKSILYYWNVVQSSNRDAELGDMSQNLAFIETVKTLEKLHHLLLPLLVFHRNYSCQV